MTAVYRSDRPRGKTRAAGGKNDAKQRDGGASPESGQNARKLAFCKDL